MCPVEKCCKSCVLQLNSVLLINRISPSPAAQGRRRRRRANSNSITIRYRRYPPTESITLPTAKMHWWLTFVRLKNSWNEVICDSRATMDGIWYLYSPLGTFCHSTAAQHNTQRSTTHSEAHSRQQSSEYKQQTSVRTESDQSTLSVIGLSAATCCHA